MSIGGALRGELLQLVIAYTDGTASCEQFSRLESILDESEDARAFYIDALAMHAQIYWYRSQDKNELNTCPNCIDWSAVADASSDEDSGEILLEPGNETIFVSRDSSVSSPIPSLILPEASQNSSSHGFGYFSSGWPVAYLIATLVTALGLFVCANTYIAPPLQIAGGVLPETEQYGMPPLALNAGTPVVGRITGMVDCVLERSGQRAVGSGQEILKSPIFLGERFNIRSGLLEISYDTGAKVILEGPVTYEVESAAGGYLAVGRLTARLENKKEVGIRNEERSASSSSVLAPSSLFAVRTPTATVTDLGTEFGIEVDAKGLTTAHVFRGKVRFASGRSGQNAENAPILSANDSAHTEFAPGNAVVATVVRNAATPKAFLRAMPVRTAGATTNPSPSKAYADLVLSMHPVMYYRMERRGQGKDSLVLFDSAVGQRHGEVRIGAATGMLHLPGRFGDALHLRGSLIRDYGFVAEYPQSQNNTLTVTAWVLAESCQPWATIAKNWGNKQEGQFHFGLSRDDMDLHAYLSQADGKRIEVREGAGSRLPEGVWQHVAMVADGARVRLYRNGREVGVASCKGLKYPVSVKALSIGCKLDDDCVDPDATNPGLWRGCIDELAIFHRALSSEAIRQLHSQSDSRRHATESRK